MARHYLDHASISPLRPEAAEAIKVWMAGPAGDPGRPHEEGRAVRDAIEVAREQVAALVGARPRQVIFTSGATEAVAMMVWGITRHRHGPIAVAPVEHAAVRKASVRTAEVVTLTVDGTGHIDPESLMNSLTLHSNVPPALVHCQWANHEVGTLQDVTTIASICTEAGIPLHVHAEVAAGHTDLSALSELGGGGLTSVSLGAGTLGGPPGIGALVLGRRTRIDPLIVGGSEERGRRAGPENVPGIMGFGAAAAVLTTAGCITKESTEAAGHIEAVIASACALEGVSVVGTLDPNERLPHLVCLGIEGIEAEPVLLGLDRAGIAVHSGSACASETFAPSPVLVAMGVDPAHSLRVSAGWTTSDEDVSAFGNALEQVVSDLRSLRSSAAATQQPAPPQAPVGRPG